MGLVFVCDSAKWVISILFTMSESALRAFMEPLVFSRRLTCPVCSWHYQDKPNRLAERDSSGLLLDNKKHTLDCIAQNHPTASVD